MTTQPTTTTRMTNKQEKQSAAQSSTAWIRSMCSP